MSSSDKFNALTSYTPTEGDNIALGQLGSNILYGKNDVDGIEHIAGSGISAGDVIYYPDVNYWMSIKAIHGADSSLIAQSLKGDDFMSRPDTGYSSTGSTYNINLQFDDVINGCFTRIRICDAVTYVQALRG